MEDKIAWIKNTQWLHKEVKKSQRDTVRSSRDS